MNHPQYGVFAAALLLATTCAAAPAAAQSRNLNVSVSTQYDSNLFRVPPAVRDALPDHGDEIVTYVVVNGGVKTRIGVVALAVQGGAGQRIHAHNPHFNAFTYGADTNATYQTPRAEAQTTVSYSHEPISFDESASTRKILHTAIDTKFTGSRALVGDVRLVGQVEYLRNLVSGGEVAANSVAEFSYGGGIGYFSPSGNRVTVEYLHKSARGLHSKPILIGEDIATYRSDYSEDSVLSEIDYQITGITSVKGSIGYTRHQDRSIFNADFAGLTADIALKWSPLPHLEIAPAYRRGFSSEGRLFSNGVKVSMWSISATEKLFGRLNTSVKFSRENRLFRYDLQASDPTLLDRRETTTHVGGGLSYTTGFNLNIGLDYEHIERASTQGDFPFAADTVTLSLSRSFSP